MNNILIVTIINILKNNIFIIVTKPFKARIGVRGVVGLSCEPYRGPIPACRELSPLLSGSPYLLSPVSASSASNLSRFC